MMKMAVLIAFVLVMAVSVYAGAATLEYNYSIPATMTNWSDTLTVSKFDSTLGTLTSIEFILTGRVDGSVKLESSNSTPALVNVNLSAELKLLRDNGTLLAIAKPLYSHSETVSKFDGVVDFGGTSGRTYSDLHYVDTVSYITAPLSDDLPLFTASGSGQNIILPINATATSLQNGPGNVATIFNTNASADVTVRYNYTAVPEPSSIALAFTGISATLGGLRLRRR